jgi:predicted permease
VLARRAIRWAHAPQVAWVHGLLTLALGIGANAAIFTLIDAVMLKSLPVANPRQLYRLGDNNDCCFSIGIPSEGSFVLYSYPLYQQLRDHTPEFSEMAAFQPALSPRSFAVRRSGAAEPAEPLNYEYVSGNYFAMFGVTSFAGRLLTPADDNPSAAPVAVMSYAAWQQHFGSDLSVIGATFDLDQVPFTIVGVTPAGFFGDTLRSDPAELWIPISTVPLLKSSGLDRSTEWLYVIGRLKTGVDPTFVQSRLTVELQQWLNANQDVIPAEERNRIGSQHIRLTAAGGGVDRLRETYSAGLRLLLTLSGLVLLIACANIANLMLARGAASRSETGVRLALGAPRQRLIRQTLVESILLALAGGAAGVYMAYVGTHAILLLAFRGAHNIPIDARPSLAVLGSALVLSVVTGVAFGVGPAWVASGVDPANAFRSATHLRQDKLAFARRSLVVLQVALSVVLLLGAGLLTESLRRLQNQQFGFVTQGRLMVHVKLPSASYTPQSLETLYRELRQRLTQIPGVLSASLSDYSPMQQDNKLELVFIQGHPADERNVASWDRVSSRYFETIGTRILHGRGIEDEDTPSSRYVAVISQAAARKFFAHEDPIGKHLGLDVPSQSGEYEIVGIVEDAKYTNAREPAFPAVFLPLLQENLKESKGGVLSGSEYINDIQLLVAGKPENLEPVVRKVLSDIDPNLTVFNMVSLGEQVARNFNEERLIARLTELFGALALVLACVGLYGITAYSVERRTNEIGIRMALGTDRRNVLALVLRAALTQIGLGLAIGVPAALAGSRVLASQLWGVKSYDPMILAIAALVLAVCAIFAASLPARRATRVDPMVALRYE